ncbi:MAG: GAF domain-containing protein, partial [Anaerolineae bacterium]|nr:GAF domain-containing protein [Anaerolineae bacterium]
MKVLAVAGNTPISNQALSILHAHEEVLVQPVGGAAEALVWLKDQEADILLLLPPFPDTATQPDLRTIRERYPHLPCLTARSQEAPVLSCDTGGMASIILTQEKLDNLPLYLKEVITSEHRKRIQKELYLREQLLWTLSSLTPVLLGEFDLDALLQHIVDEAVRLIPRAQAGSLLLLEGDAFVFRGVSGYDARLKSTRLPINANFMPSLRHGQVTQIQGISYHNSEPLAPETYVALKRYGRIREIEKTLMAPLLLDRQLIGYLTIDSFVEGAIFTPEDEETLRYLTTLATIAIHNAELFTDEHSARMLAETLQEIGTALTSTLEVDKVLDHLLEALRQLIPCDAANVMLANDEEAYITRWQGYSQLQPADLEALRLPLHSTRDLHLAAQERRIIRISDIRTYEGWVDIPESAWIRAHISVPIFLNETLVGFFNLDSATPDAFTEADEKVLTSLIPLATIALRNAQLFQSELKARALAETLQGIGTELTRTLDEAEVIQTVVKRIPNLLPFRTVIITFINGNRMSGTPYIYIQGLPPELEEKIRAVTTDEAFPLIEGVIQTQQGAVLSDARTDPHWTFAPGKENDVPISVLLAPLRSQNQVIGVLILMMDQLDFYTSEHLSTLQALADLLVVALTNARNYMEARQRAENLAALRELGLQISALQDPGAIIHRATASALALTHAAGAVFFRYDSATETFDQTEVAGVPVLPSDYRLSPGEGATGRAWVQQEPVLAQDYRTWEGRIETVGTVHALVSLPVTWQAERMGVLTLFHEDPNATFSPSDISFLQLLIQQVSANLYGADLFQALRRDRDRLAALAEIDQKIVAIADTSEEALRVILHYAVELLGLHKGLIALANEQPSQVLTLYTEGLKHTPDIQQRLLENWHHERAFYESRGPRSYVTIEDHAGAIFPILIVQEHIASALTIPLWIEGEVKGILSLMDDLPHGWGEQEIGLSLMLAQQISIALQKAMMAQEIRQRLEDAEILNRILKSVNATLNPQTILQTVCKELRSYLQVPLVQVNLYQEGDLSTTYEDMEPGYPDARSDFKCIWETSARQYLLKGQA